MTQRLCVFVCVCTGKSVLIGICFGGKNTGDTLSGYSEVQDLALNGNKIRIKINRFPY